ncbi:hypothetical protein DCAR_0519869 [Daucus carota subsp. sativus]|uniref:Zinc-finger domain-containing protein n=1 Tax=Daucus carota subsp. sativus TaxID=79200 RepID=A0AAF0X562_DAUCS|nr:hypothetical protein DCAR_0519869 [Daucus carota subsp. sativus]
MAASSSSPRTSVNREVKTCHQCPQHRSSATACKRYGEKAEEAEASEVWSCPKCRDICNCSICRNANDTGASLKKRHASEKEIAAQGKKGKELVIFEGTVLHAQLLPAIPLQQYTMEELSYPSEDMVEEVGEVAEDVNAENGKIYQSLVLGNLFLKLHRTADLSAVLLHDVPFKDISSKIAVPDHPKNSDENGKEFVDVNFEFKDHSPDTNVPPSHQSD